MTDKSSLNLKDLDLSLTSVRVSMHGRPVGTLAQTKSGTLAFQYAETWLNDGFAISPFSLPLEQRVFVANPHPLDGVFGVFSDSLPDGWGRLLVDRALHLHGIDPLGVSPLVRLAIVGASGMGALEYEPQLLFPYTDLLEDLDAVADECARVLATDYSDDMDALFVMGGSSGGARPKILTTIDDEDWIVKFPSSYDVESIGAEEFAIANAARKCGICIPEVRLLPSKKCSGYFAIKRFDRVRSQECVSRKVHMASVGALLETSHRVPNLDYGLLLRLTLRLTDSMEETARLYRLMVFNVLVGNRDDHAKNFTFLYDDLSQSWTLSPAYDLTRNSGMNGEHATTVNGKGKDISPEDMIEVARRAGIALREARAIIEEVSAAARVLMSELGHRAVVKNCTN